MGRIAEMYKINVLAGLLIILIIGGADLNAAESDITITEFRRLYDTLLAGKTLVTESEQGYEQIYRNCM
ncbi:MAG: hypothetical protein ACREN0_08215, partial [Thermodesulfobacteriota bacterium]